MGGKRGYGPTHSQSLEKYFFGIPNVDVIAINNAISIKELYKNLFTIIKCPTILIENKVLYTRKSYKYMDGFFLKKSSEKFPTIKYSINSDNIDVTLFGYGGTLEIMIEVANELIMDDIVCEVICPTKLVPLNTFPIFESIKKSRCLVTIEEGCSFSSISSEIFSLATLNGIRIDKSAKIGNESIIPCAIKAEFNLLPNKEYIKKVIKDLM